MRMKKGDILFGRKKTDAIHPIVFLCEYDTNHFIGVMLTKSNKHKDNILMAVEHFKKVDSLGNKYEFRYKNTHFVEAKLLKKEEWGPYKMVGGLTDFGIKFIESKIINKDPVLWGKYLNTK
jgi:hypothetical protein